MARDRDREQGVWQVPEQQHGDDKWKMHQHQKRISKAITNILRHDYRDAAFLREDVIYDKLHCQVDYQEYKQTLTVYEDHFQTFVTWDEELYCYFTWYKLKPSRDRHYRHGRLPRARPDEGTQKDNSEDTSS